ncbi:MAG: low temperature requirement protein A [Thermomicrobiales bacterium]
MAVEEQATGGTHSAGLLRDREAGSSQATTIELFFDLVYVFAVTQLSHHLLDQLTITGALQTVLLLAMVWLVWVYTTWVTNWLDPNRLPVRLLLVGLMLFSLVLSAGLPEAFAERGLWVGGAYALMQIGRSAFAATALRGERLQRNFQRILAWCVVSGALAVAGGFADGYARWALWLAAVGIDLLGGTVGFYTPGLGRSTTGDWTIDVNHLTDRCQAFILIALGESIVAIGATLSELHDLTGAALTAFIIAFTGSVALWWIYFDRSAEASTRVVASSTDPGRLGRSAYHFIHPIMIAGIIVAAVADELIIAHPGGHTGAALTAVILSGPVLFLAGHALFKWAVFNRLSISRLLALLALAALVPVSLVIPPLALAVAATAIVVAVAVADTYTGQRAVSSLP